MQQLTQPFDYWNADVVLPGQDRQPHPRRLSIVTAGALLLNVNLPSCGVRTLLLAANTLLLSSTGQSQCLKRCRMLLQVRELRTAQSSSPIDTLSEPFAKAKAQVFGEMLCCRLPHEARSLACK